MTARRWTGGVVAVVLGMVVGGCAGTMGGGDAMMQKGDGTMKQEMMKDDKGTTKDKGTMEKKQ